MYEATGAEFKLKSAIGRARCGGSVAEGDEQLGVVTVGREKQPTDCVQPITELGRHGRSIGGDIAQPEGDGFTIAAQTVTE